MKHIDVFNGDADGILALVQLRLAEPRDSHLVTGVKRDINLLEKLHFEGSEQLTVLDISMEKNQQGLERALAAGVVVDYFDHHRPGDIPNSVNLRATIDMDPNVCTALLVDQRLKGRYRLWAITAAYGDNLVHRADELARHAALSKEQAMLLKEFGTLINYNGYGATINDLHYAPEDLYRALLRFESPFDAINASDSPYQKLKAAYEADLAQAKASQCIFESDNVEVYSLPCEQWSRRISGVYGNELANAQPQKAHAVLTDNGDGSYLVSLRAPLNNKTGADEICSGFATGGGRKGAAGINQLPKALCQQFIDAVQSYYQQNR